jgi:hypothetical protein
VPQPIPGRYIRDMEVNTNHNLLILPPPKMCMLCGSFEATNIWLTKSWMLQKICLLLIQLII